MSSPKRPGAPTLLYIDLHLVHEVTSPQAFSGLRERGLKVRRPDLTIGTTDHSIPTHDRSLPILDKIAEAQINPVRKELHAISAFPSTVRRTRSRASSTSSALSKA